MTIAACDSNLRSALARATGCRMSPDLRVATVFVSATQAAPVLRCIRENGRIAAAFNQPSSHRTVQLKGKDARIDSLQYGDLEFIERYRNAFAWELAPLGFPEIQILTLLACAAEDIVAVRFTIDEAFSQTPGPKAGERLQVTP